MQRAFLCLNKTLVTPLSLPSSSCNLQFVRWRKRPVRKPIALGRAKTKLLKFQTRAPFEPGEYEEIKKLFNDYRHAYRSISNYFKEEYDKISDTSELGAMRARAEEEEHRRLMEENRLENEHVAKLREIRVAEEQQKWMKIYEERKARIEEKERRRLEEADRIIRIYKSQSYISADQLEDAIDKACETEFDYNFAIDMDGNVFRGRRATPGDKPSELKIQTEVIQ